jgi:hypothetical protein
MGFTFAACGDNDDDGDGGGTFTLTNIPSKYNGNYAYLSGYYGDEGMENGVFGLQSINMSTGTGTLPKISNGSVSLPMWKQGSDGKVVKYSGNDTCVYISVVISASQRAEDEGNNMIGGVMFINVPFSKGSAKKSWNAGQSY